MSYIIYCTVSTFMRAISNWNFILFFFFFAKKSIVDDRYILSLFILLYPLVCKFQWPTSLPRAYLLLLNPTLLAFGCCLSQRTHQPGLKVKNLQKKSICDMEYHLITCNYFFYSISAGRNFYHPHITFFQAYIKVICNHHLKTSDEAKFQGWTPLEFPWGSIFGV